MTTSGSLQAKVTKGLAQGFFTNLFVPALNFTSCLAGIKEENYSGSPIQETWMYMVKLSLIEWSPLGGGTRLIVHT